VDYVLDAIIKNRENGEGDDVIVNLWREHFSDYLRDKLEECPHCGEIGLYIIEPAVEKNGFTYTHRCLDCGRLAVPEDDQPPLMRAIEYAYDHEDDEAGEAIKELLARAPKTPPACARCGTAVPTEDDQYQWTHGDEKKIVCGECFDALDNGDDDGDWSERTGAGPFETIRDEHDGRLDLRACIKLPNGFMVEVAIEDSTGEEPKVSLYTGYAMPGENCPPDLTFTQPVSEWVNPMSEEV
jgi:hypothetical protein